MEQCNWHHSKEQLRHCRCTRNPLLSSSSSSSSSSYFIYLLPFFQLHIPFFHTHTSQSFLHSRVYNGVVSIASYSQEIISLSTDISINLYLFNLFHAYLPHSVMANEHI